VDTPRDLALLADAQLDRTDPRERSELMTRSFGGLAQALESAADRLVGPGLDLVRLNLHDAGRHARVIAGLLAPEVVAAVRTDSLRDIARHYVQEFDPAAFDTEQPCLCGHVPQDHGPQGCERCPGWPASRCGRTRAAVEQATPRGAEASSG